MPDENSLPIPADHNQPSARAYLHQMRQAAHQFIAGEHASEAHLLSVMECAYRLRAYKEESPAHQDEVGGLLGKEKIADTARSSPFTRLLKYAFHKDEVEKSRISRCAAALEHAWKQQPERVPADGLRQFITSQGGIVKCARASKAASGDATQRPGAAPIDVSCITAALLLGHQSVSGTLKVTEAGAVVFVPNKVISPMRQRDGAEQRQGPTAT